MTRSKQKAVNEGRTLPQGCKNCKEPFKQTRAWQEFCGNKCRNDYHNRIKPFNLIDAYYATVKEAAEIAQVSETKYEHRIRLDHFRVANALNSMDYAKE